MGDNYYLQCSSFREWDCRLVQRNRLRDRVELLSLQRVLEVVQGLGANREYYGSQ